jgi:multiple sugar transport system ATP-binding protein
VTHDQVEAMTLGHRVAVLRDGVLQQVDTPQNLYNRPANLFVAAFIGSPPMNLVEATVSGNRVSFGGWDLPADERLAAFDGRSVILGIRPSDLEDDAVWHAAGPTIDVVAEVTEELGSEVNVLFRVDAPPVSSDELRAAASEEGGDEGIMAVAEGERAVFCARVDARSAVKPGAALCLGVDPSRFYYFDPATGAAIEPARAQPAPV